MSYELISGYSDYIQHYGIKGQKWGVRRFQNEDGTLTPAGKEHYYDHGSRADRLFNRQSKKLAKLKRDADLSGVMDEWEHHERKAKDATRMAGAGASTALLGAMTALGASTNRDTLNRAMKPSVTRNGRAITVSQPLLGDTLRTVGLGAAVGGTAVAVGAMGKAIYHRMMRFNADKKVRNIERGVADFRVQRQINKMTKMFADTPYADLIEK